MAGIGLFKIFDPKVRRHLIADEGGLDPADTVVLLPAATRYETPGGVTETSTAATVGFPSASSVSFSK